MSPLHESKVPAPTLDASRATIGIITALPEEFAAAKVALDCTQEVWGTGPSIGTLYALGSVPSRTGGTNVVAVALLTDMGNNSAAIAATRLLADFPSIQRIVMCGIAGAIPHPKKKSEHVRLGDIVVSDRGGVVQYDLIKQTPKEAHIRHPPRPPAPDLTIAVRRLEAGEMVGDRPWEPLIDALIARLGGDWRRPNSRYDRLRDHTDKPPVRHPPDNSRRRGYPKLVTGPIASANTLLKDPVKRDRLRDRFGVRAVEMEASGIADATWLAGAGYLVVRGTCDYCNPDKGDRWHRYAALIAAAFTRTVIAELPALEPPPSSASSIRTEVVGELTEPPETERSTASIGPRDVTTSIAAGAAERTSVGMERSDSQLAEDIRRIDEQLDRTRSSHRGAPPPASSADQVEEDGWERLKQLQTDMDSYEFRTGFQRAADLYTWLVDNEPNLPSTLLLSCYTILAEVEVTKAKMKVQVGGAFDGERCQYFLAKARDVASR